MCAFLLMAGVLRVTGQTPSMPGKLVDVVGRRIHLNCTGTGGPAVLVVGGGFSFDWVLVQQEVNRFTTVCTYDPSGTAWSDPPATPEPGCEDRIGELHGLITAAHLDRPMVLVGFSIGGLFARLYTSRYPREVTGAVIVDHAFVDVSPDATSRAQVPSSKTDHPPELITAPSIALGLEDDENFGKLPLWAQQMHAWAMSQQPVRPTALLASECARLLERETGLLPFPFDRRPLVIVSTPNRVAGYENLQKRLMALSRNSKRVQADRSSHMVLIDQPEVIVAAIREVVMGIRDHVL